MSERERERERERDRVISEHSFSAGPIAEPILNKTSDFYRMLPESYLTKRGTKNFKEGCKKRRNWIGHQQP